MYKKTIIGLVVILVGLFTLNAGRIFAANDKEIAGVRFSGEVEVEGKTLYLNGVAVRKVLGFVKVYAVGLYLEEPTKDPKEIIESEQYKHMVTYYLSELVTAKELRKGFLESIEKCNPEEMVKSHKKEIDTYAAWLDKDMGPGLTSVSTYVPGKGLTLVYQEEERGTIPGKEFAQMYYRYNVGEKADKNIRKGLLGQ
jgi:hypothetical protein